jgi:hypothetical protein
LLLSEDISLFYTVIQYLPQLILRRYFNGHYLPHIDHEVTGEIVELEDCVTTLKVGDKEIPWIQALCERCECVFVES